MIVFYQNGTTVYLSTIKILFCQFVKLTASEFGFSFDCDCLFKETFPNLLPCVNTQSRIFHSQMYSALHCVVEVFHPIGRKEHDSFIVFKLAQEYRNDGIVTMIQ